MEIKDNHFLLGVVVVVGVFVLYSIGVFDGSTDANDASAYAVYDQESSDVGFGVTGFVSLTQRNWPYGIFCNAKVKGKDITMIGTYKEKTDLGMLYVYTGGDKIPSYSYRNWMFSARGLNCNLNSPPDPKINPRTGLVDYESTTSLTYACGGGNSKTPYLIGLNCKQCENNPGDSHYCFKDGHMT